MHANCKHREWKQFYYQPKTIRFSYETGSPHEKDVNDGISLPVFSAANVPMVGYIEPSYWVLDEHFFQAWCL